MPRASGQSFCKGLHRDQYARHQGLHSTGRLISEWGEFAVASEANGLHRQFIPGRSIPSFGACQAEQYHHLSICGTQRTPVSTHPGRARKRKAVARYAVDKVRQYLRFNVWPSYAICDLDLLCRLLLLSAWPRLTTVRRHLLALTGRHLLGKVHTTQRRTRCSGEHSIQQARCAVL